MEQDPTFMASDDTSTIDNDAEGNITIGYAAAATTTTTTGASAPTTTTTSAPEVKSEAQVQRREPSEYPRENTISASAGKPRYYKNYQFKLNLPTVVDVCSVIQIFKRARTKVIGFLCCGQKGFGFVVKHNTKAHAHTHT